MPQADGRAGMASLVVNSNFAVEALQRQVEHQLPKYARPVFLRLRDRLEVTATFKVRKGDLVRDGFDPNIVTDRLIVFHEARFRPLDPELHARIVTGDVRL